MNILKSKTIWIGVLVAVIPLLQYLQTLSLTPGQASAVMFVLGLLNIANRFLTHSPLLDSTEELG
jgi:hypothetical protein